MDETELKPSDVRHSQYTYSIVASVLAIKSFPQLLRHTINMVCSKTIYIVCQTKFCIPGNE